MYVIMDLDEHRVFGGYSPTGRSRWMNVLELRNEASGFLLGVYKKPSVESAHLNTKGIQTKAMPLQQFLSLIGG